MQAAFNTGSVLSLPIDRCLYICYLLALARLCYATDVSINRFVHRKELGGKFLAIFYALIKVLLRVATDRFDIDWYIAALQPFCHCAMTKR